MPVDVGETKVAPAEPIGQVPVVESEEREHRGVKVANGVGVLDDAIPVLVGLTVDEPLPESSAGEPQLNP